MINKYNIGDLVEAEVNGRKLIGAVHEIKAVTKRYGVNTKREGFSIIVETAPVGYMILGYIGRVSEKEIVRILPKEVTKTTCKSSGESI